MGEAWPWELNGDPGSTLFRACGQAALVTDLEGQRVSQGGPVDGHQQLQLAQAVLKLRLRVPAQAQIHGERELQHAVSQRQAADGQ